MHVLDKCFVYHVTWFEPLPCARVRTLMEAVQGRALRDMEMHMDDVVRWNTAKCTERGVTEAAH